MNTVTQDELKRFFTYNAETGVIIWARSRGAAKVGSRAGTQKTPKGRRYRYVGFKGRTYFEHRLIWLMMYGYNPIEVDHINSDGADNRLINLREVDRSGNMRNQRLSRANKSGVTGVCWRKDLKKWRVMVTGTDGVRRQVGCFADLEEARAVAHEHHAANGYHDNHGKEPIKL